MKRALGWLTLILLVVAAAWSGVRLRHDLWQWTMDVRFDGDINNGFNWGKKADHLGYFNVYDEMGSPPPGKEAVDYGPLRLGVMSAWVQWLKPRYPDLSHREPTEAFHAPLLQFNLTLEIISALAAWILTTHLIRRSALPAPPPPGEAEWGRGASIGNAAQCDARRPHLTSSGGGGIRNALPLGVFSGFIAALLIWFNPLIIWNAHAWPQWDIWPIPFYLLAVYCGCRRWWLVGGLLIGVAALLKGQILMIAWTLPVWALFIGDWRGALRFVFGALCTISLGGCVWELSIYLPGEHGFDRAMELHEPIRRLNWPAVVWVATWLAGALLLPRRLSMTAICVALGVSLYSTMWLFGGSNHWLESGFEMGTWHYPEMYMGPTSNLPAILKDAYHFNSIHYVCFAANLPAWVQEVTNWVCHLFDADPPTQLIITLRTLMLMIYFLLCAFCAIFAAINDRRHDPRLVMALTLPWLLFYLLPLQIHERYILYFSACGALLVAVGVRWVLLGIVITLVGLAVTLHQVISANGVPRGNEHMPSPQIWSTIFHLVEPTHPGIAWLLLLAAAIFLYSIVPPTQTKGTLLDDCHD